MSSQTVLIVDGDHDSLSIYTAALEHCGLRVLGATDGLQGYEIARAELPDLILVELFVPRLGGHEMVRRLRQDASTQRIPVIVVTSVPGTQADARTELYDGYLTKPCTPSRLLLEAQRFLGPLRGGRLVRAALAQSA